MHRKVTPEKQSALSRLGVAMLAGLYRFCKKHRLRPYRFLAKNITKLLPQARYCVVEMYPDVKFRIDLLDAYWAKLLLDDYEYEPEILSLMEHFRPLDYTWIDCGANYGFWSLIASSEAFGRKPVVAVEAVSRTYAMLEANKTINHRTFPILKRAIDDRSGRQVSIKIGKGHADASIYLSINSRSEEVVETISIDDLITQHKELQKQCYILKLDVEGAEIPALKGAAQLLSDKEVLIVYEDHGMDKSSAVSDFILSTLRYKIYYCDEDNSFREMSSVAQITAVKTDKVKGYNFIAFRPGSQFHTQLATLATKVAA